MRYPSILQRILHHKEYYTIKCTLVPLINNYYIYIKLIIIIIYIFLEGTVAFDFFSSHNTFVKGNKMDIFHAWRGGEESGFIRVGMLLHSSGILLMGIFNYRFDRV